MSIERPMTLERAMELINGLIDREIELREVKETIYNLLVIGFTADELIEDFNFSLTDVREVEEEMKEDECDDEFANETTRYLLNVTFYAGSDDPDDIDKGTYLFSADRNITKDEMVDIFRKANFICNTHPDELENLDETIEEYKSSGESEREELMLFIKNNKRHPEIYIDDGLNIDTLIKGVEYLTGIPCVPYNSEEYGFVNKCYDIEQWQ